MGSKIGRLFTRSEGLRTPAATSPKIVASSDESVHEQSSKLLHRLKDVYVESTTDIITQKNPYGSDRHKLPQDRRFVDKDSYMYLTGGVPDGYVTYQHVLEVLHRCKDSDQWPLDKLASEYKLDKADLDTLVKYFSSYKVVSKTGDNNAPPMEFHSLIS